MVAALGLRFLLVTVLTCAGACGNRTTASDGEAAFCQAIADLVARAVDLGAPDRPELRELRELLSRVNSSAPPSIGAEADEMTTDYNRLLDTWEQADFDLAMFLDLASREVRGALERSTALPSADSSEFSESEPESAVLRHVEDRC